MFPGITNVWSKNWTHGDHGFDGPLGEVRSTKHVYRKGGLPVPFPAFITVGSDDCIANGETYPMPVIPRTLPAGIDSRCWSNSNRPVPNVLQATVEITGGLSSTPLISGTVFVGGGLLGGAPFAGGNVLVGGGVGEQLGGTVFVGGGVNNLALAGGTIRVTGSVTQPIGGTVFVGGALGSIASTTIFVDGGPDVNGTAAGGAIQITGGIHDLVPVGATIGIQGGVSSGDVFVGGTVFVGGDTQKFIPPSGGDVFVGGGLQDAPPFVGGLVKLGGGAPRAFQVGGLVKLGGGVGDQVGGDVLVGGGLDSDDSIVGGDVLVFCGIEGEDFILGGPSCALAEPIELATTYRLDTTTSAQQWFTVPYDRNAVIAVNIVQQRGGIQFSTLFQGSCASLVTVLNSMGGVTITGTTTGAPGDLFFAITPPAGSVIVFAIYWT